MKKTIPFLLCLSLLLAACAALMPASALSADVTDSTWSDIKLKALIYQEGLDFYSDLNEEYENYDWGYKEVSELEDEELQVAHLNLRGFAITPDLKYGLMGHLNGNEMRGCSLFDFETGMITDIFYRYDEEKPEDAVPFSYPKGVAADDRGNAYVGFAFCQNYNVVNLGIAHINDETKTFEELYMGSVFEFGEPGEAGGMQVGVNGVEVVKRGEEYYCYVMINYTYDALYCYDVTDPSNPSLNKDFGDNGKIVFSEEDCPVKGDGFTLDDGDYLAVDEEGVIWLAAKSKEGSRGVMKIAPDGSACLGVVNAANPYSVCRAGKYLIIGDRDGKLLHVYDASDTEQEIASFAPDESAPEGSRFSRVQVIDDILFVVSNQENEPSQANAILAAALTADAQVKLNEMAAQLTAAPAGGEETETESDTAGADAPIATDPATDPATELTTEPATEPTAEPTTEPATDNATGDATAVATEDDGCASVIGAGAAVLIFSAMAAAVALKKRG